MPTIPPVETIKSSGPIYVVSIPVVGESCVYISSATVDSGRIHILHYTAPRIAAQGIINIEGVTQRYFRDNIKNFLPTEYWRQDHKTLADGGGEGALEHLTQVFALSLDEIKQAIDKFIELFDIDYCPPRYLYTIARLLNYPLSDEDSVSTQRKQLREAIEWYRYKGARQSFEAMLYAFGFNAAVVPLWTEDYQVFTESIPGVNPKEAVPNDHEQLVENGGTWYRSPHFGIYLQSIIGDNVVSINWDALTDPQVKIDFEERVAELGYYAALYTPVTNEIAFVVGDTNISAAAGTLDPYVLIFGGAFAGVYFTLIKNDLEVIARHENVGGTDTLVVEGDVLTYGLIDLTTGGWSLTFDGVSPDNPSNILATYAAPYSMFDKLIAYGAQLHYSFNTEDFNYVWQRIEYIRPVFEVLEWLGFMLDIEEYYGGPTPVFDFIVNPVLEDRGWYLGYCDLNDAIYTRLDPRLLGDDYLSITSPLGASSGATPVAGETVYPESGTIPGAITYATGTLDHVWLHPGVIFYFTRGAATVTVEGTEGSAGLTVTSEDDDTTYGRINYLTGFWEILFEGVPPDTGTYITADYSYSTDIPPVDRSDALPRGATKLPFPLLRNPKEGYCYAPEELYLDVEHDHSDPYALPLTRDGMNLYNDWNPGDYVDQSDFPSRGFTSLSGAGSGVVAGSLITRATGESDRVLSVLRVGIPLYAKSVDLTDFNGFPDWIVPNEGGLDAAPFVPTADGMHSLRENFETQGPSIDIYGLEGVTDFILDLKMKNNFKYGVDLDFGEDRIYVWQPDYYSPPRILVDGVVENGVAANPRISEDVWTYWRFEVRSDILRFYFKENLEDSWGFPSWLYTGVSHSTANNEHDGRPIILQALTGDWGDYLTIAEVSITSIDEAELVYDWMWSAELYHPKNITWYEQYPRIDQGWATSSADGMKLYRPGYAGSSAAQGSMKPGGGLFPLVQIPGEFRDLSIVTLVQFELTSGVDFYYWGEAGVGLRCSGNTNGYMFAIRAAYDNTGQLGGPTGDPYELKIYKAVTGDGVQIELGSYTSSYDTYVDTGSGIYSPDFKIRSEVFKGVLRARMWLASEEEPTDWQIEITDTTFTEPGWFCIWGRAYGSGSNPGYSVWKEMGVFKPDESVDV